MQGLPKNTTQPMIADQAQQMETRRSKIEAPSVRGHSTIQSFLIALRSANRDKVGFSFRSLSIKLGFAQSLISDVMASRRKIPLAKAIRLANYLELSSEDKMYLAFLSQIDQRDQTQRGLITELLG